MIKNFIKMSVYVLILFSFCLNYAQQIYKDIPSKILKEGYTQYYKWEEQSVFAKDFANAIHVENYLPKNYSKEGDKDYTDFLQRAIDKGKSIVMPDFPILINDKGIHLKSNTKVFFNKKSQLIMKPNDKTGYQMIGIQNIDNVDIYFPRLKGDKSKHLGNYGEWGMGILIKNCRNIKIINPEISDCWGDGIYIGATDDKTSQNILVENALLDNNRRNGISIISGKNVKIINSLICNTTGISPNFGIDVEPNNNTNILENITLQNNTTYNNKVGVGIVLDMLIGKKRQNVGIRIISHSDYNSVTGIEFFVDRGYSKLSNANIVGQISVENLKTYDTDNAIILNKSKAIKDLIIKVTNVVLRIKGKQVEVSNLSLNKLNSAINKGQKIIIQ